MRELVPDLDCMAEEYGLDAVLVAWDRARVFLEDVGVLRGLGEEDQAGALVSMMGAVSVGLQDMELVSELEVDMEDEMEPAVVPE